MHERVDPTDDERAVFEGDHEVLNSLADRLAECQHTAGPITRDMGRPGALSR